MLGLGLGLGLGPTRLGLGLEPTGLGLGLGLGLSGLDYVTGSSSSSLHIIVSLIIQISFSTINSFHQTVLIRNLSDTMTYIKVPVVMTYQPGGSLAMTLCSAAVKRLLRM